MATENENIAFGAFIGAVLIVSLTVIVGYGCHGDGVKSGRKAMEIEAVEKGFGEYVVSEKKVEFRWKTLR